MLTPQLMQRQLFGYSIRSNHKTNMFCITDLATAYNAQFGTDKQPAKWAKLDSTAEFKESIARYEGISAADTLVVKNGRGGGTWAHPLLLVDFALWLSPEFKYVALSWLHDNLHTFRDYAGDTFKERNAVCKEVLEYTRPWHYADEAAMVNRVAKIPAGVRNELTEKQLSRLGKVQKMNIKLIQRGVRDRAQRERKLVEIVDLLS